MPEASWCRSCGDYVWVALGGGCSNGHPRSDLQRIYQAPAAAGMFVPPPPARPDGRPRDDSPQVDLLPQPTFWRVGSESPVRHVEYRSSGSRRGVQIAVILGVLTLCGLVAFSANGRRPDATNGIPVIPSQPAGAPSALSQGQLVIQDHKTLVDANGRRYVSGSVMNQSGRSITRVDVTLTLYDTAGTALGSESTELGALGPGESGRFEIPFSQANAVSFSITAASQ